MVNSTQTITKSREERTCVRIDVTVAEGRSVTKRKKKEAKVQEFKCTRYDVCGI
jgi:hypothetical protein